MGFEPWTSILEISRSANQLSYKALGNFTPFFLMRKIGKKAKSIYLQKLKVCIKRKKKYAILKLCFRDKFIMKIEIS